MECTFSGRSLHPNNSAHHSMKCYRLQPRNGSIGRQVKVTACFPITGKFIKGYSKNIFLYDEHYSLQSMSVENQSQKEWKCWEEDYRNSSQAVITIRRGYNTYGNRCTVLYQ